MQSSPPRPDVPSLDLAARQRPAYRLLTIPPRRHTHLEYLAPDACARRSSGRPVRASYLAPGLSPGRPMTRSVATSPQTRAEAWILTSGLSGMAPRRWTPVHPAPRPTPFTPTPITKRIFAKNSRQDRRNYVTTARTSAQNRCRMPEDSTRWTAVFCGSSSRPSG